MLGLDEEPLTDLAGSPQLSGADRWMEAARIAFPKPRNEQEVTAMQQRFTERFQGSRSERYVYLSKMFGRRSTLQNFKGYLRTGELPEPQKHPLRKQKLGLSNCAGRLHDTIRPLPAVPHLLS